MSKIMCDICGTMYPDTADSCPICGCSRDAASEFLGEEFQGEEIPEEAKAKGGKFTTKKKKEIFDFDEVNSEHVQEPVEEEANPYEEEETYEERGNHNVLVVILLTILIALLLGAAGFIFFRYYLPNTKDEGSVTPPTQAQIQQTEATTAAVNEIPCEMLILSSGTAELTKEGQHFLLHVQATPKDTTDKILYVSEDESIATVTEDGRITAVGEGETTIMITCGMVQTPCTVTVRFEEETVPPTTEETVPATEETLGETEPVETEEAAKPDVVLKLEKKEISLGVYRYVTLKLDCDLQSTDVEWSSEHPHIASVDENGKVTAHKDGVTSIVVKYGDQEVKCMVRCVPVN